MSAEEVERARESGASVMGLDHEQRAFKIMWKQVHACLHQLAPEAETAAEHPTAQYAAIVRAVFADIVATMRTVAAELIARAEACGHGQ